MLSDETFKNNPDRIHLAILKQPIGFRLLNLNTGRSFRSKDGSKEKVILAFLENDFQTTLKELFYKGIPQELKHLVYLEPNGEVSFYPELDEQEYILFIRYYLGYSIETKVSSQEELILTKREIEGELFSREQLLEREDLLNFDSETFTEIKKDFCSSKESLAYFKKQKPQGKYFVFKAHSGLFYIKEFKCDF